MFSQITATHCNNAFITCFPCDKAFICESQPGLQKALLPVLLYLLRSLMSILVDMSGCTVPCSYSLAQVFRPSTPLTKLGIPQAHHQDANSAAVCQQCTGLWLPRTKSNHSASSCGLRSTLFFSCRSLTSSSTSAAVLSVYSTTLVPAVQSPHRLSGLCLRVERHLIGCVALCRSSCGVRSCFIEDTICSRHVAMTPCSEAFTQMRLMVVRQSR